MKKRIRIAEVIMAIIFIAATASAGGVYYTPLVPKTFECLVFELNIHQLRAVESVDEKGSKFVHVDVVPRKLTEVFYYRHTSGGRFLQCWHAKTTNGTSLAGSGESRQAVMVMNAKEGSADGYIVFIMDIPKVDAFTPSAQLHLSGTFEGEWNEAEQRYILKHGSGVIAGHSTATKWAAWDFLEQAVPSIQSPMSPVWGSFMVRREVFTEKEIVQLIK